MNLQILRTTESHYVLVGRRLINLPVITSFLICISLIIIGIVRNISYLPGNPFLQIIEKTPLHLFTYQPENYFNIHFIKILATPAIVALIYFLFRSVNDNKSFKSIKNVKFNHEIIDFSSFTFRLTLTTMITICWLIMEIIKFNLRERFYPYSDLENPVLNIMVLIAGQVITIIFMKLLSFGRFYVSLEELVENDDFRHILAIHTLKSMKTYLKSILSKDEKGKQILH